MKSCPGCAEKVAENPCEVCGHRFDASAPIAESKEAPSVDGSREWKDLSTWEKYVAVVVLMCLAIAVGLSIYLFVNGFYNGGGVLENVAFAVMGSFFLSGCLLAVLLYVPWALNDPLRIGQVRTARFEREPISQQVKDQVWRRRAGLARPNARDAGSHGAAASA